MKKTLFVFILLVMLILIACAPAETPAATEESHEEMSMESSASSEAASSSSEVSSSSVEESAPAPTDGTVIVQVTVGDNWIESELTTFKVGVPYEFVITNTSGSRTHNFNINPVQEKTDAGAQAALAAALLSIPNEQFGPGSQVVIGYIFTQPAPEGTLEFSCLIARHYKSGQYLPIVVEP